MAAGAVVAALLQLLSVFTRQPFLTLIPNRYFNVLAVPRDAGGAKRLQRGIWSREILHQRRSSKGTRTCCPTNENGNHFRPVLSFLLRLMLTGPHPSAFVPRISCLRHVLLMITNIWFKYCRKSADITTNAKRDTEYFRQTLTLKMLSHVYTTSYLLRNLQEHCVLYAHKQSWAGECVIYRWLRRVVFIESYLAFTTWANCLTASYDSWCSASLPHMKELH